jgi:hypothetical protein
MKLPFILLLLVFPKLSFTQNGRDTTIKLWALDSIKTVVYKLKDSLRRLQYENSFLANYYSTDSSIKSNDSIIIKYKSKNGKLIKAHTKKFRADDGSFMYEKVEYCNSLELPEFIEHWEQARSAEDKGKNYFIWQIYSYERFVYDSSGRVIVWIKFYPAVSRSRVRRYDYVYSLDGTRTFSTNSIELEKFWD